MDIILKYFNNIDTDIQNKLAKLHNLYIEINKQINLISRKDISNLYLHHFLHSLSIIKIIELKSGSTIIDVGTGGGFPGIPLSIFLKDCHFVLLDSIRKKINAIEKIKEELKLKNIECVCARVENYEGKFDYIIGRAVSNFSKFVKNVKHLLKSDGNSTILYLKGGEFENELKRLNCKYTIFNLREIFAEEYFENKKLICINGFKK